MDISIVPRQKEFLNAEQRFTARYELEDVGDMFDSILGDGAYSRISMILKYKQPHFTWQIICRIVTERAESASERALIMGKLQNLGARLNLHTNPDIRDLSGFLIFRSHRI